LQVGGTTLLVVQGSDLGTAPRLLLPFAAKQDRKPGSTPQQATFDVTLGGDVVPGVYPLRIVTEGGVSLPAIIGVDRLPQRPFAVSITGLPVALHGTAIGGGAVETTLSGKAGQKLLIEVEAHRFGSKLRPIIHLYNRKRTQLAWAWGARSLHGDARLEAMLPEDGPYTIAIHDVEYAPPGPAFFRLKVGQWSCVDRAFPPAIATGKQSLELLGPGPPARIDVTAGHATSAIPLPWPKEGTWSGLRPFVAVSPHAEFVEQASSVKGQDLPAGQVGVSGRLLTAFEEDRYRIPVQPGEKLRFEVFAERLGSLVDAALVVRNETGLLLARGDDGPGTLDPVLDFIVPDKTTSLLVGVLDAQGLGGPKALYRLAIEPQAAAPPRLRLLTTSQGVSLPIGGRGLLPVLVDRQTYGGSITLAAHGLPAGVMVEGATIPAGASGALVSISTAAPLAEAVVTLWQGRAEDGREQDVVVKDHPLGALQPWLGGEVPIASTTEKAADFALDYNGLPADAGLLLGGKLALPVNAPRPLNKTLVRLELVTSQPAGAFGPPVDPNTLLRLAAPMEIAANATDTTLTVLVPGALKSLLYDVAVRAEFLPLDRSKVLAVAYTPVRRMVVRNPLVIQHTGPPRIVAKLVKGKVTTVEIKGKVERREGIKGMVLVTLAGLPPGLSSAPVQVPPSSSDFTIALPLAGTGPARELKGLKLSGIISPEGQPGTSISSREVELTLVVEAAPK
jgi:hypothetical protein